MKPPPDPGRLGARAAGLRPVLYLDLDDTVLSWADGEPRAVPASRSFVLWALEQFEVRWLTRWCPSGLMPENLLRDLAKMLQLEPGALAGIQGCGWEDSGSKVDGITWLEHTVLGRPFYWVENREGLTDRDIQILESLDVRHRYLPCNVSRDEAALTRARHRLERLLRPAA